jgi:hypothetical protein
MAKTLKELFKTQKLDTGTTGQAKYEVRNSKDIEITTSNPLLAGTSFPLVNRLRKGPTSQRTRETLFEEETTGLRPLRFLSTPVLYGTDIIRLTTLRTSMVDDMKVGANGGVDAGLYGNAINRLKQRGLGLAARLGVKFPQELIPSRLKTNTDFQSGLEPDTMATLAKIKGDAAGNLVGKFLAKNAKGTPEQIRNQAIGSVINLVKDEARKFLFGGRKAGQTQQAKKSTSQIQYDRKTTYSSTIDKLNTDEVAKRNDLSTILEVKNKADITPPTPQYQKPYITKEGFGYKILSDGTKQVVDTYIGANMTIDEAKAQVTDFLRTSNRINKRNGTENPDGSFSYPPPFTPQSLTESRKEAQQELSKAKGIESATRINYGPRILKGSENSPSKGLYGYSSYLDPRGRIDLRGDLSSKLYYAGGMPVSSQKLAGNPNNIETWIPYEQEETKDLLQEFRSSEPLFDPINNEIIEMPDNDPVDLSQSRKEGQRILGEKITKRKGYQYLKYEKSNPYTSTIDEDAGISQIKFRNDLSTRLANFGLTDEFGRILAPLNVKMGVYGVGTKYDGDTIEPFDYKIMFPYLLQQNTGVGKQVEYAQRYIKKSINESAANLYSYSLKYSDTDGNRVIGSGFENDLSNVLDDYQRTADAETDEDITPYDDVEKNRKKSVGIQNKGVPKLAKDDVGQFSRRPKKRYSIKNDDVFPQVESELPQLYHDDMLGVKIGEGHGGSRIILNKSVAYIGDGNDNYTNADFATLRFYSVFLNTSVNFLATITALTENWTPSWQASKFIGNAFNFYTYENVERSVSFQFKIFSTNDDEHKAAWERINFLSRLTMPQGYGEKVNYLQPPIIQLTMGDIYHKRPAFIETLSYSVDDTYTWDTDTPFYTLPKIINVDITLKLLLSKEGTDGKRLYDYGGRYPEIPSGNEKKKEIGADGIPLKNLPLNPPKVTIPTPKITIPGTPPLPPPVKTENPVKTTDKKPIPPKIEKKKPDPVVPNKQDKYIQKVPQFTPAKIDKTFVAKPVAAKPLVNQQSKNKLDLRAKKPETPFWKVKSFQGFGGGTFGGGGAGGSF